MAERRKQKSETGFLAFLFRSREEKPDAAQLKREEELLQRMERRLLRKELYRQKHLSMVMLAREVGTNRTYVSSALKHRGLTFSSYIGSFRVMKVVQLLSDPACANIDAGEAAELCGFMSERTMNYYLTVSLGVTFTLLRRRCLLMREYAKGDELP